MINKRNVGRSIGWGRFFPAVAIVLVLSIGGCAPQADMAAVEADAVEEGDVDVEADEAAIRRNFDEATAAINAGDGSIADLDTEDVVIMYDNGPMLIGREAVRESNQIFAAQFTYEESRSIDEVVVSGDLGFVRWNGMGTITAKDGGEPTEFNRKGISIVQRQPDNSWMSARVIWNSSLPEGE